MKKTTAFLLFFLLFIVSIYADVPGKEKMNESKITLQGINNLKGYSFHYRYHYGDKVGTFGLDTTFIIPPSGGAPDGIELWGTNNKTGKCTDTLNFNNYYAPDAVILFNKIENDSIYITKKELSNKNEIVDEGSTDNIDNKQLVAEAKGIKKSHYTKIILLSVAGLAALAVLTWLFIRKRKSQKEKIV
jgi:hypothetical protein